MQLDFNALNPHPGFASTIFISWDDIAEYFSLFEYWPLLRDGEEPPEDLVNFSFEEARKWAQAQTKQQGLPPTDDQIFKAETAIIESLKEHWSAAKALDGIFDFATCAKLTNEWSHKGARRPELFGVTPDPGKSIDYILSNLGVSFTVYPPFIIPYTEIYYRLNDNLPEWDYEDLNGTDILETIVAIYEEKVEEVSIELTGWANKWEGWAG